MRIGILGSGLMGGKLGTIFANAGHEVVFSYSRSQRELNPWTLGHCESPDIWSHSPWRWHDMLKTPSLRDGEVHAAPNKEMS